jgi:hypothetical protein
MILRSVGVFSVGKLMGAMYGLMGLLAGGFISLISVAGVAANMQQQGARALPFVALGAGAVIIMPIIYGVLGFILGIISAVIYNMIAAMIGGIEMEFVRRADVAPVREA